MPLPDINLHVCGRPLGSNWETCDKALAALGCISISTLMTVGLAFYLAGQHWAVEWDLDMHMRGPRWVHAVGFNIFGLSYLGFMLTQAALFLDSHHERAFWVRAALMTVYGWVAWHVFVTGLAAVMPQGMTSVI